VLDDTAFESDLGIAQIKGHETRFDLHLQGSNAWGSVATHTKMRPPMLSTCPGLSA
jgi:hypothetical protein